MDPLIIDNDTWGLGLQRQSPPSSPPFPSGGDADSDSDSSCNRNAQVRS